MSLRVLVSGCAGSIGVDVCRSLAQVPGVELLGTEASRTGCLMAQQLCRQVFLLPCAREQPQRFLEELEQILRVQGVDFLWLNPDPELEAAAQLGWLPPCAHPLPGVGVLRTCLDKFQTAQRLTPLGLSPGSWQVEIPEEFFPSDPNLKLTSPRRQELQKWLQARLEPLFEQWGTPLWIRPGSGAGGIGSWEAQSPEEAACWMALWAPRRGVKRWVVQEFLPGRNFNCTLLYVQGKLVAKATMQRLGYFLAQVSPTGITGQVNHCCTVDEPQVEQVAQRAIGCLDPCPHGIYSVDLREDVQGAPRVTEVNPRLAGRPWLYTQAGCNLPRLAMEAFTSGNEGGSCSPQPGWQLLRQLDLLPTILPPPPQKHTSPRTPTTGISVFSG